MQEIQTSWAGHCQNEKSDKVWWGGYTQNGTYFYIYGRRLSTLKWNTKRTGLIARFQWDDALEPIIKSKIRKGYKTINPKDSYYGFPSLDIILARINFPEIYLKQELIDPTLKELNQLMSMPNSEEIYKKYNAQYHKRLREIYNIVDRELTEINLVELENF